jgi:hypothetical protein
VLKSYLLNTTRKIAMNKDDVNQLRASCITAAAFLGLTAITFSVMYQEMLG